MNKQIIVLTLEVSFKAAINLRPLSLLCVLSLSGTILTLIPPKTISDMITHLQLALPCAITLPNNSPSPKASLPPALAPHPPIMDDPNNCSKNSQSLSLSPFTLNPPVPPQIP